MTFVTLNGLRQVFRQAQRRSQHAGWIPARTGHLDLSSGVLNPNPFVGLPSNKIWVRRHARDAFDGGRGQIPVWNTTFAISTNDTPVWIGHDPDGELEIKGLRNHDANNRFGAALQAAVQTLVPPELFQQLHRVLNIFELRAYVREDGALGFRPGWINRLYWDDGSGIDPLAFKTSTSGMQAWVVVYMDASSGALALDAITGGDLSSVYAKDRADIEDVLATLPAGAFPLFALLIRESDTTFSATDETKTEDLRDRWRGVAPDAHLIPYTPDDGSHWNDPDPENAGDALDQAAERITDAEGDIAQVASDLADHEADGTAHPLKVRNTSGATANAGDVGYLDPATNDYKTTTTALFDTAAPCAVVVGGADNADIWVLRRGRVTVNYTGTDLSAGDYVVFSAVAGHVQRQTSIRQEVVGVVPTGATIDTGDDEAEIILLHNELVVISPTNNLYEFSSVSTSDFVALINGTPSGTSVVYDTISSGAENVIVPSGTALSKLILYNTTRGNSAQIASVNTGTNTITLTDTVPGNWANNDSITVRSQTNTDVPFFAGRFLDLAVDATTVIPANAFVLVIAFHNCLDTGGVGVVFLHPFQAGVGALRQQIRTQGASLAFFSGQFAVPFQARKFEVSWEATGAGTLTGALRLRGALCKVP